jgi:XTP/dITP diphosphohydrolase
MPTDERRRLLIATGNKGKAAELTAMLEPLGVEVIALDAFPAIAEVTETGTTFGENATLKATQYAAATGVAALADDSGLEVAALGGRPGVLSARYGGEGTSFEEKMRLLLSEIDQTAATDRTARFVCAMTLADANGSLVATVKGICTGIIAREPRGKGGFGYDPIFVPQGYDATFGELPEAVKAQISHRSRAFSQIMPVLARFFGLLT